MRTFKKNVLSGLAVGSVALIALTACGGSASNENTDEGTADGFTPREAGKLTMCSDIPYEPFEFNRDGEVVGLDVDIAKEIASDLDLELNIIASSFDSIESGLFSTQCDLAISSISITEPRQANMDFSDPYLDDDLMLVARKDSGITDLESAKGKRVGVQQATTGESYTNENAPEGAEIVSYPSDGELWPAIQAGQIDAILQDQPVNIEHERADSAYTIVEEYDTAEQYGFAFAKGEKDSLRDAVNAALQELRDDGTYQEIYDTYFSAS